MPCLVPHAVEYQPQQEHAQEEPVLEYCHKLRPHTSPVPTTPNAPASILLSAVYLFLDLTFASQQFPMQCQKPAYVMPPTEGLRPESAGRPRYKIVLLGDAGVGKSASSIDGCTTNGPERVDHGANFAAVERDQYILDFWDTAGQERYRSLVPFARDAHVALIVDEAVSTVESGVLRARWASYPAPDASVIEVRSKVDYLKEIGAPLRPREGAALASAWTGEGMETLLARIMPEAARVAGTRPDPPRRFLMGGRTRRQVHPYTTIPAADCGEPAFNFSWVQWI